MTIGHDTFEVAIREELRQVEHVLTPAEQRDRDRGTPYFRPPRWDHVPSGRLQLRTAHRSGGVNLVADRERWKLEQKLPQVFGQLEAMAADAAERRAEVERDRQAWIAALKGAVEDAKRELIDRHRLRWLRRQQRDLRVATEAREFVAAAAARPLSAEDREWLQWIQAYAEERDPLGKPLAPPPPPEPTAENLRPLVAPRYHRIAQCHEGAPSSLNRVLFDWATPSGRDASAAGDDGLGFDVASMEWTPAEIGRRFGLRAADIRRVCDSGHLPFLKADGKLVVTYQALHDAVEAGVLPRPADWLSPEEAAVKMREWMP